MGKQKRMTSNVKRMEKILVAILIFLSVCIGVAVAQPLPYSLSGHIYNSEGDCIVGAEIILVNERTGDVLVLTSTTNGEYQQDAYNFINHYKTGDTIRYEVTYEDVGAIELANIDISKGGTKLDLILTKEGGSTYTTPKSKAPRKTSSYRYTDTDGDGISDNEERARGWDKNDPCVPNPKAVACKSKAIPQVTPEMFSPVVEEPTPIPTVKTTPRQTSKIIETQKKIPGFVGLEFFSIVVLFLYKRRRR